MTADKVPGKPSRLQLGFLLGFHAVIAGAFLVSYVTGDADDVYFMHVFAGYAVLVALAARLAAGLVAAPGSMLRLPRPDWRSIGGWLRRIAALDGSAFLGRSPLHGLLAVLLLVGVGVAAAIGAVADYVPKVEDLHEALGEAALYIVIVHVALVLALHGLKRLNTPSPRNATASVPAVVARPEVSK